jgi:hypothetical protein
MTTRYMLKQGAVLRAEDVVMLEDPPAQGKPPSGVMVLKHPADVQGVLDLQPKKPKPWADAHPKLQQPFNMRLSDELHKKLKHCAEIVPGARSMQQLALKAIADRVEELLKQYDKD